MQFYQATLTLMRLYLQFGPFPQVGLGFVHFASISLSRFGLVQAGFEFGSMALKIFEYFESEFYAAGRGLTLYALFLGHLQREMRDNFGALNKGLEAATRAGDKGLHMLATGIMAAYRFWAGDDLAEIEAYIASVGEEFPDWEQSLRGGVFLMGVRQ